MFYYLPIASALLLSILRILEVRRNRNTVAGKVEENLTFRLFVIIGGVMTLGSITEYLLFRTTFSWSAYAVGVVCAIVSFKLRWAAIAALGKFWSLHVEIRDNHEFVQSGPFSIVRHPTYFSMILELLAFGLLCNAWIMLALIPLAFIPTLVRRLRLEETALEDKFGDSYRQYQKRVPILVPCRWPISR